VIEVQRLKAEMDAVKKERDLLKERESQHLESLKILKKEVDALTLAGAASPPDSEKELDRLRIENELFATQIIENEVEMREIRSVLEFLDAENSQMRKDLESVRGKLGYENHKPKADPESKSDDASLAKQVEILASRLTEIERERNMTNESLEEERRLRTEELKKIKEMMVQTQAKTECFIASQAGGGSEGIEVTMEGPVECRQLEKRQEPNKNEMKNNRDGWGGLCDCFPRSNVED
jgi:hypothetical protein